MDDYFAIALALLHEMQAKRQTGRTTAAVVATKLCGGTLLLPLPADARATSSAMNVDAISFQDLRYRRSRKPLVIDHYALEHLLHGLLAQYSRDISEAQSGARRTDWNWLDADTILNLKPDGLQPPREQPVFRGEKL